MRFMRYLDRDKISFKFYYYCASLVVMIIMNGDDDVAALSHAVRIIKKARSDAKSAVQKGCGQKKGMGPFPCQQLAK